ncbi:hypothetical protein J3P77_01235 [Pseudomonas sp. R1-18]|uniref:hypothetical protein n=1 Tax=Pseudomonas sp. R1-18 TaxID=1632772 RepID=UPI003DA9E8F3
MQYITNGNFINGLESWQAPEGFEPAFEPRPKGQSVRLLTDTLISQTLPDLPGQTLRIEFDVKSADPRVTEPGFAVSVGGFTADGTAQVSPVLGVAPQDWQRLSVRLYFQDQLNNCFINVATPSPAKKKKKRASTLGPVRFGGFSLTEEQPS